EEDLLQDPEDGNLDGWGLAMYAKNPVESPSNGLPNNSLPNNSLEVKRSLLPAFQDVQYDTASEVFVQKKPFTLLAHILNKVDPRRILIDEKDTHPFSFQNWSAMFNGFFNGSRTPPILEALETKFYPALGARPQGTNSGEMIMFYFLGKLKSQFGTLDSSQLGIPKLQRAFAETLQAYYKQSDPMYSKLDGSLAGLKGKIQWGPSSNYFVTDGKVLMAYRKGRKLYLNQHVGAKGKLGYLVSSEPIQPKNKKLSWVELPQDHILTLAKQPDGKIEASLTPMTVALTQSLDAPQE
ncbi:MAG: hypothetical protein K2X66_06675, partial [Cyanobacteria bacterium]|nr:hypothetical protein [Cyanobacteriota bacterium]